MFAVLRKTAMSAIIYEVLDAGTAVTDAERRPRLLRRRHPVVRRRARQGGEADPRAPRPRRSAPGDVFVDERSLLRRRDAPERRRARDAGVRRRAADRLDGDIAHWNDVGGMAPGSISADATEIFQEGLRLPAVKLVEAGRS